MALGWFAVLLNLEAPPHAADPGEKTQHVHHGNGGEDQDGDDELYARRSSAEAVRAASRPPRRPLRDAKPAPARPKPA